jgi:hypothetical protein
LETLKLQLPQNTFRSFVESTRLVAIEGSTATIELSDVGAKDWIGIVLRANSNNFSILKAKISIRRWKRSPTFA